MADHGRGPLSSMIFLLAGTDYFRLQERVQALEQAFLNSSPQAKKLAFDCEEAWGESERALLTSSLSMGLFATPYCIVVRGAEVFEEKEGIAFSRMITAHDPSMTIVVTARFTGKQKLPKWWTALGKQNGVTQEMFSEMNAGEQKQYLDDFLKRFDSQLSIEPRAKQFLLSSFAHDSGRLIQEVKRLALETTEKNITLAQALAGRGPSMESATFAALDALIQGNRARAIALFRQEEREADAPFALLGLCAWQVRRLIAIKELTEQEKMSIPAIAKELKTSSYPIQKTLPLLPRLSFDRLRRALMLLADFDQALKTGRMRPGVALDLFVWKF